MPPAVPRCTWPCRTPPASQPNIIVAAANTVYEFSVANGTLVDNQRVTFTGDTQDPPGGTNGSNADTRIFDLAIQPDGKIVVVGLGLVVGQDEDTFRVRRGLLHRHGGRPGQLWCGDGPPATISLERHHVRHAYPAVASAATSRAFRFSQHPDDCAQANGVALTPMAEIIVVGTDAGPRTQRPSDPGPLDERGCHRPDVRRQRHPAGRDHPPGPGRGLRRPGEQDRRHRLCQPDAPARHPAPEVRHPPDRCQRLLDTDFANEFGVDDLPDASRRPASIRPPSTTSRQDLILLDDGRIIVAGTTQDAGRHRDRPHPGAHGAAPDDLGQRRDRDGGRFRDAERRLHGHPVERVPGSRSRSTSPRPTARPSPGPTTSPSPRRPCPSPRASPASPITIPVVGDTLATSRTRPSPSISPAPSSGRSAEARARASSWTTIRRRRRPRRRRRRRRPPPPPPPPAAAAARCR